MKVPKSWTIIAAICLVFLLVPPAVAYASVQYVGPPPLYFCCKDYGDATDGWAPRTSNIVYRELGSGIAGLIYSGFDHWLLNTGDNPFTDYRDVAYAQAACSNQTNASPLKTVTCFTVNG